MTVDCDPCSDLNSKQVSTGNQWKPDWLVPERLIQILAQEALKDGLSTNRLPDGNLEFVPSNLDGTFTVEWLEVFLSLLFDDGTTEDLAKAQQWMNSGSVKDIILPRLTELTCSTAVSYGLGSGQVALPAGPGMKLPKSLQPVKALKV